MIEGLKLDILDVNSANIVKNSIEISLEQIQPILHARIEETLLIIYDKFFDVDITLFKPTQGGIFLQKLHL